ncbi:MAG TPA: TROVE domain-containing protein [Tepidisphaeraceae bacterium]|jgi:60 kDa SS-A/Ro ribonucleoprotein|nr:TROVE domain-containing protein [Tepidisphaeraceae bacterium]
MANKTLFQSFLGKFIPPATTTNEAGGVAYQLSPKAALAQYAATGCLSTTFYASAETQLQSILSLCSHPEIEPEFIARLALYTRTKGHMKDTPALLCAVLSVSSPGLLAEVFDRVIDDGRMLRNFVQIMRSGVVGRKSLGTLPKRLVQSWFSQRTDEQIFRASVGNDPSLVDVIRMVHPKPQTPSRAALYGYLIGQPHDASALPEIVKQFESFKAGQTIEVPNVPFQMLTSLDLKPEHWKQIAKNAPWQMTRMNLNTFVRHGVFEGDPAMIQLIADRLRDPQAITQARVFPYQLLMAYIQTGNDVPPQVREALQDAMEIATRNVPKIDGQIYICPDVSGSMHSPITGHRSGATSAVRCVDVAALVAATFLRTNPTAEAIPFKEAVIKDLTLNPRDSIMTNSSKMTAIPPGGTNCSAPLAWLNTRQAKGDLVVFVSDNESWVDQARGRGTATMEQWTIFKARNPAAKLVCIDLQPHATTQAAETGRSDVLNIGGFSDTVFDVIAEFSKGSLNSNHWVGLIEQMSI